jgi:hypothetical protein
MSARYKYFGLSRYWLVTVEPLEKDIAIYNLMRTKFEYGLTWGFWHFHEHPPIPDEGKQVQALRERYRREMSARSDVHNAVEAEATKLIPNRRNLPLKIHPSKLTTGGRPCRYRWSKYGS